MKKLTILTLVFIGLALGQRAGAQIKVSINIGSQPDWGPTGYDHVDYYYMPDIDVYYNVPQRRYIYPQGNRWIVASTLPARYSGFNLYSGYKVVVNSPKPYLHDNVYRAKYAKYKGGHAPKQEIIRDSHDARYKNNGHGNNGHANNGKNKGHGKTKGHDQHDKGR